MPPAIARGHEPTDFISGGPRRRQQKTPEAKGCGGSLTVARRMHRV